MMPHYIAHFTNKGVFHFEAADQTQAEVKAKDYADETSTEVVSVSRLSRTWVEDRD